jgi:hypothetical protein
MAEHRGGSGNFAEDREKASEAGKKADSTVGVILKMTLNVLQKPVKKVARTATAVIKNNLFYHHLNTH